MIIFIVVLSITLWSEVIGQETSRKVICTEYENYVLTHGLVPAGPVPTAFDPNGVYPYTSYSETANRPVPVKYKIITLENDQGAVRAYNSIEERWLQLHPPGF